MDLKETSATNQDIKDKLKQLAKKNYDNGYHKGFDNAIDKVLYYLNEEITTKKYYSEEDKKDRWLPKKSKEDLNIRIDALIDFQKFIIALFKMVAVES